jgi:peptidoglycan/xylan/chitin deacetylase (PgdA/CDA1 family)
MLTRTITWLLAPGGNDARLSVLIFHRVLREPDDLFPNEPDAVRFESILGWLKSQFTLLPLERALDDLYAGKLPARAASITFDDGYADNVQVALPLLVKHRVPATFFIATGFLKGATMFNDRIIEIVRRAPSSIDASCIPGVGTIDTTSIAAKRGAIEMLLRRVKRLALDEREQILRALEGTTGLQGAVSPMMDEGGVAMLHAAGMGIGAHTHNHPILAVERDDVARHEIQRGRDVLADITGRRPAILAYPNGAPGSDFDDRHVAIARDEGFKYALSTAPGCATRRTDPYRLPRFTPWDQSRGKFTLRMLANLRGSSTLGVT